MREILFRGKSLYDNKWVEGFYVHANKAYGEDIDRHFIIEHGEFEYDNYDAWKVIPKTVGQYTGLTDKNGKKIFEGDIIRRANPPMLVVWDEDDASFKAKYNIGDMEMVNTLFGHHRLEVIGNIHDNPELLEVDNV